METEKFTFTRIFVIKKLGDLNISNMKARPTGVSTPYFIFFILTFIFRHATYSVNGITDAMNLSSKL